MPFHCSVPKCKGNYTGGPKVAVFGFPKDEQLKKTWLNAIKREDFVASNSSKVCELHFQTEFIERSTSYIHEVTGQKVKIPLKFPRLKIGAIPTKLPGCPAYLSRSDVHTRVSPQSKRSKVECRDLEKAIAESIESCSAYNSAVSFATLAEAFTKVSAPKGWIKAKGEKNLCFFYLDESSEIPVVRIKVYVSEDLSVNVLFNNIKAKKLACDDVDLIFPVHVTDINFLDKILCCSVRCLNSITQKSGDKIKAKLGFINYILEDLSEEMENSQENSSSDAIKFVQKQIQLSTIGTKARYRYSCEIMLFSCLLFQISPHAYKFLQQKCQRQILSALIFNAIKGLDDIFIGHNNTCHTEEKLCKLLIKPLTNILLKNYIKERNDMVSTKSMPHLKRFKVNTNKN